MTCNIWAYAFTPGVDGFSQYLDSAGIVITSQYANLLGGADMARLR